MEKPFFPSVLGNNFGDVQRGERERERKGEIKLFSIEADER